MLDLHDGGKWAGFIPGRVLRSCMIKLGRRPGRVVRLKQRSFNLHQTLVVHDILHRQFQSTNEFIVMLLLLQSTVIIFYQSFQSGVGIPQMFDRVEIMYRIRQKLFVERIGGFEPMRYVVVSCPVKKQLSDLC